MAMQAGAQGIAGAVTEYTVQSGDTVGAIALAFHSSVQAITALNHLNNPNLIYTGEKLVVPSPRSGLPTGARPVVCTLTAYTDGYASTGKVPGDPGYGITSTGQVAMQGLTVAVDPGVIPYGTPLLIPGVGVRIAEDTGGAIIGNHIDVFYNSNQTALDFGVKHGVLVYILPRRDIAFIHRLPVLAQDVLRARSFTRHATVQTPVYTSSAVEKAAAALASPTGQGLASDLLTSGIRPPAQSRAQASPAPALRADPVANAASRRSPAPTVLSALTTQVLPAHARVRRAAPPSTAPAAASPRVDVMDAWNIVLEQDVWQPMLRAATRAME